MGRMMLGLMVLALAVSIGCSGEKPTEEFKKLRKEFDKAMEVFEKELDGAKTPEEEKEIKEKFPGPKFSARFLAFAQKNASAPEAMDALLIALGASGGSQHKAGYWNKVMKVIERDHIKNEKIGRLVRDLAEEDDESSASLLRAVVEKNPSKKIQGRAVQVLIERAEKVVKSVDRLRKDDTLRANIEKVRGKEYVAKLLAEAEKSQKEKDELTKLLDEKYADVVPNLSIGKTAPEVVMEDLKGKKTRLSDLRGKVVVLDIWATWCPPCREMIPHTRKLVERFKDKPFVFVSISVDEDKETVENFMKKTPMPWTHWHNGAEGGIVEDWSVKYFPTIYVLDARGVIRAKDLREKELDEFVEKLVKEMEDGKKK